MKDFSGKRIRQSSKKLAQLKRREKRLRRIALSVLSFVPNAGMNWAAYFRNRNEERKARQTEAK